MPDFDFFSVNVERAKEDIFLALFLFIWRLIFYGEWVLAWGLRRDDVITVANAAYMVVKKDAIMYNGMLQVHDFLHLVEACTMSYRYNIVDCIGSQELVN